MKMAGTYCVLVGIVSTALAQISLKLAGTHKVLHLKWSLWLLLSLTAYAVSFLTYYLALKSFDISKVQPIMMAGIIAIISLYGFATGENFDRMRLSGVILSIISIFLISKS